MAKEPEPKATGQGSNSPFSIEGQLSAFKARLDGPVRPTRTIPGFLFRDGCSSTFPISTKNHELFSCDPIWLSRDERARIAQQAERANFIMTHIDDDLLEQHTQTYRKGLEARDQLRERIKPVEMLEMVRDVWGKGEIKEFERGAALIYYYPMAFEQSVGWTRTEHHIAHPPAASWFETKSGAYLTGKWSSKPCWVSENITVDFGNSEFPAPNIINRPNSIYTSELDEFFADKHRPRTYNGSYDFPITLFQGIPRTIWRRPDNLGISVTVPYAFLFGPYKMLKREYDLSYFGSEEEESVVGYLPNTSSRYLKTGRDNSPALQWFDQSVSQQEIMDYLSDKLEAQRAVGQLPSQVEALELAKIEELRKRGLFKETAPKVGKVWGSGAWIPGGWLDHS